MVDGSARPDHPVALAATGRPGEAGRPYGIQGGALKNQTRSTASSLVSPVTPRDDPGRGAVRALVLRAWLEPGALPHLRARIVEIVSGRAERVVVVTTSVDEACRAIREWLETLQAEGTNDNDDGIRTQE
jgi:hypothetical protein